MYVERIVREHYEDFPMAMHTMQCTDKYIDLHSRDSGLITNVSKLPLVITLTFSHSMQQ
jgi:hypothetical protein